MDHGEITTGAYEQVWHECFNEVRLSEINENYCIYSILYA